MTTRRFWVFIEQEEGEVHPVSWELLGVANELASQVREEAQAAGDEVSVEGLLLGSDVENLAQEALRFGADRVFLMDSPELKYYRNRPYYLNITALAEKYKPEVFLIGATTLGRDLAGSVATSLHTGLTADCTQLQMGVGRNGPEKLLMATRPAFGGNVIATILCQKSRPQMASVRPRVFPTPAPRSEVRGEIVREKPTVDEQVAGAKILEIIRGEAAGVKLEYADIIVAGGRGVGGPAGFKMLEELAEELGGVVGASRGCVDAGWIEYDHQVGQTGQTVRPKLYIAAGISGAIQHKVGMQGSDFILAINRDPQAPIFEVADLGIVGDVNEVIPNMLQQIRAMKEAYRESRN